MLLTYSISSFGAIPDTMRRYRMMILKFFGQQATMADQSSSTSLGCSLPNCWENEWNCKFDLFINLYILWWRYILTTIETLNILLQLHLDRDVEEIVGDHLRRLRRAPSFATSTLLRINPNLTFGTDIGINQLQVVEPRQQVIQETLNYRWSGGLKTVTNFWKIKIFKLNFVLWHLSHFKFSRKFSHFLEGKYFDEKTQQTWEHRHCQFWMKLRQLSGQVKLRPGVSCWEENIQSAPLAIQTWKGTNSIQTYPTKRHRLIR